MVRLSGLSFPNYRERAGFLTRQYCLAVSVDSLDDGLAIIWISATSIRRSFLIAIIQLLRAVHLHMFCAMAQLCPRKIQSKVSAKKLKRAGNWPTLKKVGNVRRSGSSGRNIGRSSRQRLREVPNRQSKPKSRTPTGRACSWRADSLFLGRLHYRQASTKLWLRGRLLVALFADTQATSLCKLRPVTWRY